MPSSNFLLLKDSLGYFSPLEDFFLSIKKHYSSFSLSVLYNKEDASQALLKKREKDPSKRIEESFSSLEKISWQEYPVLLVLSEEIIHCFTDRYPPQTVFTYVYSPISSLEKRFSLSRDLYHNLLYRENRILRNSKGVFVPSEVYLEEFQKITYSIEVMYPPVRKDLFSPSREKKEYFLSMQGFFTPRELLFLRDIFSYINEEIYIAFWEEPEEIVEIPRSKFFLVESLAEASSLLSKAKALIIPNRFTPEISVLYALCMGVPVFISPGAPYTEFLGKKKEKRRYFFLEKEGVRSFFSLYYLFHQEKWDYEEMGKKFLSVFSSSSEDLLKRLSSYIEVY